VSSENISLIGRDLGRLICDVTSIMHRHCRRLWLAPTHSYTDIFGKSLATRGDGVHAACSRAAICWLLSAL